MEHAKNRRPVLLTQPLNISLKTGESTKLECIWNNTREKPQVRWLKWPADKIHLLDLSKDIKTQTLASFKKYYEIIDPNKYESFSLHGRSWRYRKGMSYGFRLRLKNVRAEDTGMYTCIVKNEFGSDHRNVFVNVQSLQGKFRLQNFKPKSCYQIL